MVLPASDVVAAPPRAIDIRTEAQDLVLGAGVRL